MPDYIKNYGGSMDWTPLSSYIYEHEDQYEINKDMGVTPIGFATKDEDWDFNVFCGRCNTTVPNIKKWLGNGRFARTRKCPECGYKYFSDRKGGNVRT